MPRKILIVDDLISNRRILNAILKNDYEILEAASGEEALSILLKHYESISAVLLDISMPGIDGYEVLRRIRSSRMISQMPVIMITGSDNEETRVKSLTLGANDFVMKPYSSSIIKHCLENNIAFHEAAATVNAMQRDTLTGLYNREAFFDKVQKLVKQHEPGYYIMSCFDIDRFKIINDQYGSEKGDEVLRHTAKTFKEGFEPFGGVCCRIYADKFAIIYPESFRYTSEIVSIRDRASHVSGLVLPITFSIGRYVVEDVEMSPSAMYDRAVLAANTIKGRYDEKIGVYSDNMRKRLVREQEIVMQMENALESGQFEVWFQPQYNHATDAMIGAEALVRWRHPKSGLIPPDSFIPVFEQNGFVYSLDRFVWESVCRYLRKWIDEGRQPLPVSVNVSRYDAIRPDVVEVLTSLVRKYDLPIELLRLEVTESAFAGSPKQIVSVVKEFINNGFTVEIDDFGSGYSSLNTLKDVPAQIIKLDMKFMQNSSDSKRGGNIVESIVRMAKWLGVSVIAEGVETLEQANYLLSVGCSYMQGYLYSRPLPVDKYEEHCQGCSKEERLISLETVENLDNNAFWDPNSMDTLIFNSYVGGACIFEYHNGNIELLRATKKYVNLFRSSEMTFDGVLSLDWSKHLDEDTKARLKTDIDKSISDRQEVVGEYVFHDLPGCPKETYLRSTLRVIAVTGERNLVYCATENITDQRLSEEREREAALEMRLIMENIPSSVMACVLENDKIRILFANDRYYEQLGYTKEDYEKEFSGSTLCVVEEDAPKIYTMLKLHVTTKEPYSVDFRIRRNDGELRWLRSSVTSMTLPGVDENVNLVVTRDITRNVNDEHKIRRLSEQMQAIMDNVDLGIIAVVVDNGNAKYMLANDRYYGMLGYTKEQFSSEVDSVYATVDEKDRQRVIEETAKINRTGESTVIVYTALKRDASKRVFRASITTTILSDIDRPVQLSIVRDITEETEALLREKRANEQAHAIMRDAVSGITATIITPDGDVEILFANDKFYEIHGYTCEQYEALTCNKFMLVHPLDREKAKSDTLNAYSSRTPAQLVYRLICPDGSIRWVKVGLSSTRFTGIEENVHLCVFTDITQQKRTEQEMQETSEQLCTMMDDIPGGFVRLKISEDGRITPVYLNNGFLKLVKMDLNEALNMFGANAFNGVHPDDEEQLKNSVGEMVLNGEARSAIYRLITGKGDYIYLSVFGRMTKDATGQMFLNIYYSDATEQVKEEQQQKELLDNLPFGAALYEYNDGKLTVGHLNKRYLELLGSTEPNDQASSLDALHPDDVTIVMRELTSAMEQKRDMTCDIRLRHETKGYLAFHIVGRIVPVDEARFAVYVLFIPITDAIMSYQQTLVLLLEAIVNSTNDMSFAKDRALCYMSASRAFSELVGLKNASDIVGKTDYDLFDKDLADKYRQDDEAIIKSGLAIVDKTEPIPSKNGEPRYSSTSKYVLRDGAGTVIGLYGVGRDITKSVNQDSRLALVNDSIPVGLATFVCVQDDVFGKNARITYYNDGFCRLFGYSNDEGRSVPSNPMGEIFDEDYYAVAEQWQNLMLRDIPIDCVYRVHVGGAGFKWISHKAVVADRQNDTVVINAILQDVTSQREIIERLRISEEENNLAVKLGGNVVCRYMVEDKTLVVTPETAALFSISETITGVPEQPVIQGMISPESVAAYVGFFKSIQNGSKATTATFQQRYLGGWRWIEAKSSTIFSDDGKPVKAVISFNDVTERLESETIYKKWQQSLSQRSQESYTLYRCNLNSNSSYDTTEGSLIKFDFKSAGGDFNDCAREYAKQLVDKDDQDKYTAFVNSDTMLASYYRGKRSDFLEYREVLPAGEYRWLRLTVDLVEYPNSSDIEAYMMYENIDAAKRAELLTKALSENDPLTGILNRMAFSDMVEKTILASKPSDRHALLMLDIDGFKRVNDVFGHAVGDQTLIDVAGSLRSILRHDDLVARLGGDEFMVLLKNVVDDGAASVKAKQICKLVRKSFSMEVHISASIGIAMIPRDGMSFDALYKKADAALYHVKGSGKDNFLFYEDGLADEHLKPEADSLDMSGCVITEKKRRMLIVDDSMIDYTLLKSIFSNEFIIEKARDGASALIRLRHYTSAISIVLLDLMMPQMDGFAVLEKMQASAELRSIPVIIVSGDESRDTCLKAIRNGATDFITKPVDAAIIRIRVHSAISRAENERLRARNYMLEVKNEERIRYAEALESAGVTFIEYNLLTGQFIYYPSISRYLYGEYNDRPFWQILLSDMVADTKTVHAIQTIVYDVSRDRNRASAGITAKLKTPTGHMHNFRLNVRKQTNDFKLTSKLIISLNDLDYEGTV